jgi:hypothetical protein
MRLASSRTALWRSRWVISSRPVRPVLTASGRYALITHPRVFPLRERKSQLLLSL